MKHRLMFVALGLASIAGTAAAGVSTVDVTPVNIDNLSLPVDNVWNGSYGDKHDVHAPGKDFGYTTIAAGDADDTVWIKEVWTKDHSPSAVLGGSIFSQGRSDPVITINKSVDNFTTSNWTGFDIALSTLSGNINLIGTPTATLYAHTQVFNNKSGMVVMSFDTGTVHPGDTVDFSFTFSVPYTGLWTFTITQTPTPTPGSLVIGATAAVMITRRRRA